MSDCGRPWGMDVIDGTCKGCWAAIFQHLITKPTEKILPRPEFCQDAAFIAYTLDSRLASQDALDAIGRKILSRDVQPQYEPES